MRLLVGVTGGISSGKTVVTRELVRLGARVVDADAVYHDLLTNSGELKGALVAAFGAEYFDPEGRLDRRKLGARVFSDPAELARLNAIAHPPVIAELFRQVERLGDGAPVFLAVPLLYEASLHSRVDRVVVVYCTPEQQLARLMARDGIPETLARARQASQIPIDTKRSLAHDLVDNTGTVEETHRQVAALYARLVGTSAHA